MSVHFPFLSILSSILHRLSPSISRLNLLSHGCPSIRRCPSVSWARTRLSPAGLDGMNEKNDLDFGFNGFYIQWNTEFRALFGAPNWMHGGDGGDGEEGGGGGVDDGDGEE